MRSKTLNLACGLVCALVLVTSTASAYDANDSASCNGAGWNDKTVLAIS